MRRSTRVTFGLLAALAISLPLAATPVFAADTTVTDLGGLKAAVDGDAGCEAGDTVTLGADIDVAPQLAEGQVRISCDVVIDLNGHRLAPHSMSIAPGAQVTITDTATGGGLDIDTARSPDGGSVAGIGIESAGTGLVIEGNARATVSSTNWPAVGSGCTGCGYGDIVIRGDATVEASTDAQYSAAIGGGSGSGNGAVTIGGNAAVTATLTSGTGAWGAAIGDGFSGRGATVTITDSAHVVATAHDGSGIGAGSEGTGRSTVVIDGNAVVEASASGAGAGIGSGDGSSGSDVTIRGAAHTTGVSKFGAGIGGGGDRSSVVIEGSAMVSGESEEGAGIGSGWLFTSAGHTAVSIAGDAQVTGSSSNGGAGIGAGSNGGGSVDVTIDGAAQVVAFSRLGAAVGHGIPGEAVPTETSTVALGDGATLIADAPYSEGNAGGTTTNADTAPYEIQIDGKLRISDGSRLHVPAATSLSVGADGAILGEPDNAVTARLTGPGVVQNQGVIALTRPDAPHLVEGNSYLVRFQRLGAPTLEDVWVYAPSFDTGYRDFPALSTGAVWNTLPTGQGAELAESTDLASLAVEQMVDGHRVLQVVGFEVTVTVPSTVTATAVRTPVTVGGAPVLDVRVGAFGGLTHTGGLEVYIGDTSGDPVATGEIEHDGTASIEVPGLGVGSHELIVRYLGNDVVDPSDSDPVEVEVLQAGSTVSVSGPNEATVGDTIEWSATARSIEADDAEADPDWGGVVPTGDVQVLVDGMPYGDPAPLAEPDQQRGEAATGDVSLVLDGDPGEYTVEVVYTGDENVTSSRTSHGLRLTSGDDGGGDTDDRDRGTGNDHDGGAGDRPGTAGEPRALPATGSDTSPWLLLGLGAMAILGGAAALISVRRRDGVPAQ